MLDILVIGPVNGRFHLGYWDESRGTFLVIQPFENKGLAEAAAYQMIQFRANHAPADNNKG